mmetsp:Transcript_70614/g.188215  ORF Transcript_70614/g.188215 Transcript_70614/m.188215 type:complete len:160 (-) Transcript_70614:552-1031(-)
MCGGVLEKRSEYCVPLQDMRRMTVISEIAIVGGSYNFPEDFCVADQGVIAVYCDGNRRDKSLKRWVLLARALPSCTNIQLDGISCTGSRHRSSCSCIAACVHSAGSHCRNPQMSSDSSTRCGERYSIVLLLPSQTPAGSGSDSREVIRALMCGERRLLV